MQRDEKDERTASGRIGTLKYILAVTLMVSAAVRIYLSSSSDYISEDDVVHQNRYTSIHHNPILNFHSDIGLAPFNSNVVCPPNIYSATTRIENETLKITGPMGCVVSFLPDPLEALTSSYPHHKHSDSRWIISSGGSTHWGASMNLLRLFLKESDDIPHSRVRKVPPDVIELKIRHDGVHKLKVWQDFENYGCAWKGKDDQNILIRVTVLHSRWMDSSADMLESIINDCGHHRPKPDLMVDVRGKWHEFCSKEDHGATWQECILKKANEKNSKGQYQLDANTLLQRTNSINARSLLFVDRSNSAMSVDVEERKSIFQRDGKGTYLTLDSEMSVLYPYVCSHPSSAFAVGDAMAFLHTILGQRHQASDSVEQGWCYDISFMNDACNPKNAQVYNNSWAYYYTHHCSTEAVPCIEKIDHAEVLFSSNQESDNIHRTTPSFISVKANGLSPSFRCGLVLMSGSLIVAFIYIEGKKAPVNSMPGIGTLRFIASLHIVAGHLQRFGRGYMTPVPFAEYGYTWVPWFMLLSAFVLSWSAVNKKPGRDFPVWYEFVLIRVRGIYPLYIAGLIVTTISSTRRISPGRYMIDMLLLQSWYPGWTEGAIMPHTWFLSAITPCWMLHGFLFRRIEVVSTNNMLLMLAFVTFLPMFCFGVMRCWWCGHETNQFNSIVDALVIMLKFHPLCYLPIYASGICIAHLLHRWKSLQNGEVQGGNYSEVDWIDLIKPFPDITIEYNDTVHAVDVKLKANNSFDQQRHLHPSRIVYCLIRNGCSFGSVGTFISFFLARKNHFHGAKLVFRLGFLLPWHALLLVGLAVGSPRDPVRRLFEIQWIQIFGNASYAQYIFQFIWFHKWYGRVDVGFWAFCIASSILAYYLIDRPCKAKKWFHGGGGIVITAFLIFTVGYYAHIDVGSDSSIALWAFDDASAHRWINPSIIWVNRTTLLLSARRLQIDKPASARGSIWSSDIGIGEVTMNTGKYGPALNANSTMRIVKQDSSEITSCHTPTMWIRGVEDPRLLMVNGSLYLTAVHHSQRNGVCVASPMLIHSNETLSDYRSQRLRIQKVDMTSTKNWVHMKDHHFMTNVTTSTVVRVNPQGGEVEVLSDGEPSPWLRNMHGGSNLVESTSVVDGAKVWIGVVHSAGTYRNRLVEFDYKRPYSPRRMSKILPLYAHNVGKLSNATSMARGIAFASGLAPCEPGASINKCLIITYGSNDREARAFVLEKEGLFELFHKGIFTSNERFSM